MKRIFVFAILLMTTMWSGSSAHAASTCQVTLTSPAIYKSGCEAVGSVNFSFDAGTVFSAGDWWYMDLPSEVNICSPIDYLIVRDTGAGAVDIRGGTTASVFDPGTGISTMAPGTKAGPLGVSPGDEDTVVAGGDIAIRVTAQENFQRVLLQVYGSTTTATVTVGAGTRFSVKIVDGRQHRGNMYRDTDDGAGGNPDGIYGNAQNQADLLGGATPAQIPEPDAENTLCVNAEGMKGDLMFASFSSFQGFVTFTSDAQIAHVVSGMQQNVSSLYTWDSFGGCHTLSLEVPSGQQITSPCAYVSYDTPSSWVSFPYGYFAFNITGMEQGGITTMTVYLDGDPPQTYYKYGKTPDNPVDHWYEFFFDGETGAEAVGNTIVLHFVDGERGDNDLKKNGKISDPGGPAAVETREVLYFPYLITSAGEETELGIINCKDYEVTGTIFYYRQDGGLAASSDMALPGRGKTTISAGTIPSDTTSAIVSADGELLGYARYVNSGGQRCAWPASTRTATSVSVPVVAIDEDWRTGLALFNPNNEKVSVTMTNHSGATSVLTLAPYARDFSWLHQTEDISSISATGGISVMETFESLVPGGDRAALLLKDHYLDALYVPTISNGPNFTAAGFKNGHFSGTVSLFGYNATGAVEEVSLGALPSQGRMALDLSGELGDGNLWAQIAGVADHPTPFGTSPMLFQGLAAYGENDNRKLGAIKLNALRFKDGFLGIVSADPEPTFVLLNPNPEDGTATVTSHRSDGTVLACCTIQIGAGANITGTVSALLSGAFLADVSHVRIVSNVHIYGFETIYTGDRMEMLPVLVTE